MQEIAIQSLSFFGAAHEILSPMHDWGVVSFIDASQTNNGRGSVLFDYRGEAPIITLEALPPINSFINAA